MIFQDPLSSLHPYYRVGWQISEVIRAHDEHMSRKAARNRAIELLRLVGISAAGRSGRRLSAPVLRRHAPAGHDRHGHGSQPRPADR